MPTAAEPLPENAKATHQGFGSQPLEQQLGLLAVPAKSSSGTSRPAIVREHTQRQRATPGQRIGAQTAAIGALQVRVEARALSQRGRLPEEGRSSPLEAHASCPLGTSEQVRERERGITTSQPASWLSNHTLVSGYQASHTGHKRASSELEEREARQALLAACWPLWPQNSAEPAVQPCLACTSAHWHPSKQPG